MASIIHDPRLQTLHSYDNLGITFSVLQYNIDMAMREESHPETKWTNRNERIAQLILKIDADIVCLQELRELPDGPLP